MWPTRARAKGGLLGLTGGIGSGKSLAARLIREAGTPVLDADEVAREVVAPGNPAHAEIVAAWPEVRAADGTIDRKRLGSIVFGDPAARTRLESITHPRIVERSLEHARALAAQGHTLVFYEAALLVETGRYRQLDGLVVVTAPEDVRIRRIMARDGITAEEARARMTAQLPEDAKAAVASYLLVNDGDVASLRTRVRDMLAHFRRA